jgi:hypothetical protein
MVEIPSGGEMDPGLRRDEEEEVVDFRANLISFTSRPASLE